MKDIFGRRVNVGDKVAVGMAYGRSSVLRVGEVLSIKETPKTWHNGGTEYKWSIRIKWSHNGSGQSTGWGEVRDSTILHESTHRFAKLLVLPPGFVDAYPPDVEQ